MTAPSVSVLHVLLHWCNIKLFHFRQLPSDAKQTLPRASDSSRMFSEGYVCICCCGNSQFLHRNQKSMFKPGPAVSCGERPHNKWSTFPPNRRTEMLCSILMSTFNKSSCKYGSSQCVLCWSAAFENAHCVKYYITLIKKFKLLHYSCILNGNLYL